MKNKEKKEKKTTYLGSYIDTIDGKKFHISFTHQFDDKGNMINEKEISRVELNKN